MKNKQLGVESLEIKNETLTYCSLHFIDLRAIRQSGMRFFSAAELKKCDVDEKNARISQNRGLE